MDSEIPEKYVDVLLQEFAYDPVRLPLTEDPAQVLYNRATLETIWDDKHEAVNPFTRQPFDISNVIPQTKLRKEMQRYIMNNSSLTLKLDVISDYTQILSEADMKILMEGLISDYECLVDAEKENGDCRQRIIGKSYGKNLIFSASIANTNLKTGFRFVQLEDTNTCCGLVDLIGLKDTHFPPHLLFGIFAGLSCLVVGCDELKIRSMVLRIYRQMFYDLNVENLAGSRLHNFCFLIVKVTLSVLKHGNLSDIANEDLYNGMLILKAAWTKNRMSCINSDSNWVDVVVHSVILCISRLHLVHHEAITDESRSKMVKKNDEDDEAKNFQVISVALEGGLWLINAILTATASLEERENEFLSKSKKKLQASNIVTEMVRMVQLVLAGFKCLGSSHLHLGIEIVAALIKEEGPERRDDVVQVFDDFIGSGMVAEFDSHVKLLLQEFMYSANASH